MTFKDFLFFGHVSEVIKVGSKIVPNNENLELIIEQEKDLDNQPFKNEQMYELRFVIERTNAWLDAFKALIMRYETKIHTWQSLHYLAFTLIFARTRKKHS